MSSAPALYLLSGISSFLLLQFTFIGGLPTITSFLDVGQQLIVVGICLFCWRALLHRDYETLTLWLLFCLVLPLFTTAVLGFMGFGAILGLIVLVFVFRQVRSRMTVAVIGLITVYLGLSLFVTYKRDRREIRSALWTQNSVTQSIESTAGLITDFEFFSADEPTHLEAIDRRLNQNYLVGAAVEHSRMTGASADGETAMNAIYALIPRVIWPNKPIKLGGAEIAERYTGLNFASNVSIGIGKVMEFYINFGPWGIVFGYLLFGATVAYLDVRAGSALHAGNWPEFAQWFLPGLMFLKILGPLVELSVRFVAAFVLGWLVNRLIGR
jgi:ABC-type multidrug transport system fused ATPase/permease subunit